MSEPRTDEGRMTLVEHLTELRTPGDRERDRRSSCSRSSSSSSTTTCCTSSPRPYEHVTRGKKGCGGTATTGLQADRHRPARAVPRAAEGLDLRRDRALGAVRVLADLALRHARDCTRTSGATASCFLIAIVVLFAARRRRGVVHGARRRSSSCSASAATRIQPFITADKYLTLVTLMIAAFGVAFEFPVLLVFLMLVRVREHPPAPQHPALDDRRDRRPSRRSSPRARTRSPYSSWLSPCTSSTRSRS